jgi:carboxyl-terminal processing protease
MNESNQKNTGKHPARIIPGYFAGLLTGATAILLTFFILTFFAPNVLNRVQNAASPRQASGVETKISRILHLLDTHYIGEIDRERLIDDMFRGLVFGVGDTYTVYMTREEFEMYTQDTGGSFVGIGVVVSVDKEDNLIEIIAPYEGSPGEKAGLLPRDKIVRVNGYNVTGDILQEAIRMIRGVPGTTVTLTIFRDNETFDVDIVRDHIEVPTVSHEMLEDNIGFIRINQFAQVTDEQFFAALNNLKTQDMRGLILDLRNNPGGRLDTVLNITNALIPEGVIMYTETRTGPAQYHYSDGEYLNLPLLILVNGNSASASEVLAGAVRDTGVGQLVGTTTYGKGVVQQIIQLPDGSAVKITTSKYYTPSGASIQDVGIEPHYKVEMESNVSISSLSQDEDVQLQRAMEIMRSRIR